MNTVICLDLEGVLVPEIWINVAKQTGIKALERTTRDEPDYDKLMKYRLAILRKQGIKLKDIQAVIAKMNPLPGAKAFLDRLRSEYQVVILSDTFAEFAKPLMKQLGWPTIFCHRLSTDSRGFIKNYHLRLKDQKKASVLALQKLNFRVKAAGDSYNDLSMILAADEGVLFRTTDAIRKKYRKLPAVETYAALLNRLKD
jgi:phosphoserine/homoserine phosphotransferase